MRGVPSWAVCTEPSVHSIRSTGRSHSPAARVRFVDQQVRQVPEEGAVDLRRAAGERAQPFRLFALDEADLCLRPSEALGDQCGEDRLVPLTAGRGTASRGDPAVLADLEAAGLVQAAGLAAGALRIAGDSDARRKSVRSSRSSSRLVHFSTSTPRSCLCGNSATTVSRPTRGDESCGEQCAVGKEVCTAGKGRPADAGRLDGQPSSVSSQARISGVTGSVMSENSSCFFRNFAT